ncbi:MAG TPA: FCD domain-containing protein, partial [Bacillaceae bacterium]
HITNEIIGQLAATNERFATAVRTENYFSALKIDEAFHQIIVDAAANTYIIQMLESLQAHVRRLFFHNSVILTEQSIDEHAEIIRMLKEKEAEGAALVMRKNWSHEMERS